MLKRRVRLKLAHWQWSGGNSDIRYREWHCSYQTRAADHWREGRDHRRDGRPL